MEVSGVEWGHGRKSRAFFNTIQSWQCVTAARGERSASSCDRVWECRGREIDRRRAVDSRHAPDQGKHALTSGSTVLQTPLSARTLQVRAHCNSWSNTFGNFLMRYVQKLGTVTTETNAGPSLKCVLVSYGFPLPLFTCCDCYHILPSPSMQSTMLCT